MTPSIAKRLESIPWDQVSEAMTRDGYAVTPALLTDDECATLIASYEEESLFRSRIVMARFGFGRGENRDRLHAPGERSVPGR